jgi:type II secretory ATPase GspE/PulE/Tfp pilus assembly ATPase PilB-like protein
MISEGAASERLRTHLQNENFRTLFDDADEKISLGETAESEIKRELGERQFRKGNVK